MAASPLYPPLNDTAIKKRIFCGFPNGKNIIIRKYEKKEKLIGYSEKGNSNICLC